MSEGTSAVRTVEKHGVAVTKAVEENERGVTIDLEVTSELEEPAVIGIVDPALESVARDQIELDGAEAVRESETETPSFERELGPGESWTVSYRIVDAGGNRFDGDPRVTVSGNDGIDTLLDRSRSDALREFVSGERESLSTESATGTEDPLTEEGRNATGTEPAPPTDGVARELLAELRGGELDRETKAALRAELEPSRSRELRIKHLQQQVSDLAAYTEMLEVFIDEHGSLDEAVGGLGSELEAIKDEQAELQTQVDTMEAEIDRVDGRLDALEEFRESVSSVFTELDDTDE